MAERGTITGEALKYRGLGYVFGGRANRPGNWDCSSFISYVLGHDLREKLPGGGSYGDPGYPPHAHGPVVTSYASWAGASAVRRGRQQPGDLVCWVGSGASGHIGIVLGANRMISALDSADGTKVTAINGFGPAGAPMVFRRVKGVPGGAGHGGPASDAADTARRGAAAAGALAGLALAGAATATVLLAAAAVAAGLGLALTVVLARAASSPDSSPGRPAG